jgi:hypothetical protein
MTPRYPRIPHLAAGAGVARDDLVLDVGARERLLSGRVLIEEKLDGANLGISLTSTGDLEVASRGGPGAIDRGRHLGRARAWVAEHSDGLRDLLADGSSLYGEWLLTRHGVGYHMLPDLFVGFDLLNREKGWASVHERDERLHRAGVSIPPSLCECEGIRLAAIDELMGPSAFGAPHIEGVIVRAVDPSPGVTRLAKRLAVSLQRVTDQTFGGSRKENRLAHPIARQ